MNEDDLKKVLESLGLKPGATTDEILIRIESLKKETPDEVMEHGLRLKYIQPYEKKSLLQMAKDNPVSYAAYMEKRKKTFLSSARAEATRLISEAIKDRRLNPDESTLNFWRNSFEYDFETTKSVLLKLNGKRLIMSEISPKPNAGSDRSGWTLEEYRKKAPKELSKNPALYRTLLEDEKARKEHKNN